MEHTIKIKVRETGLTFDVPCAEIDSAGDINLESAGISWQNAGKEEYDAWLFKRDFEVISNEIIHDEEQGSGQKFEVIVEVTSTEDLKNLLASVPHGFLKHTTINTK